MNRAAQFDHGFLNKRPVLLIDRHHVVKTGKEEHHAPVKNMILSDRKMYLVLRHGIKREYIHPDIPDLLVLSRGRPYLGALIDDLGEWEDIVLIRIDRQNLIRVLEFLTCNSEKVFIVGKRHSYVHIVIPGDEPAVPYSAEERPAAQKIRDVIGITYFLNSL